MPSVVPYTTIFSCTNNNIYRINMICVLCSYVSSSTGLLFHVGFYIDHVLPHVRNNDKNKPNILHL